MWRLQQSKTYLIRKESCITLFTLGVCSCSLPKCFMDNSKAISSCSSSHYKAKTTLLSDKRFSWNPNAAGPLFGAIHIALLWLKFKQNLTTSHFVVSNNILCLCRWKVKTTVKEKPLDVFLWFLLLRVTEY